MRIPDKVKIGWREYRIEQGEHRAADNGGDLYGEIQYEQGQIYIYDKQTDENKAVSLLHEIVHGILYLCGRKKQRDDEGLVTALSENLYQVIKDNPEMFNSN